MIPPNLFSFERDEFADLNWMPLEFRYRLDLCGLKLPLAAWQRFSFSERALLLSLPCESETERAAWIARLKTALLACGREEPASIECWIDPETAPGGVREKLAAMGREPVTGEWKRLKPVQRYALCKLARSKQGDRYFPLAVGEFGF